MHFSIPDTQDLKDVNATVYKAYNVHINGVLHCVVRYSQVFELNEQLKQHFGSQNIPSFPPKRFLQVKGVDLDERRLRLERYIQEIGQNPKLSTSELFVSFLCNAQRETQREESIPISFDVYMMNGKKITLDINSTDKTNDVLESAVQTLGLNPNFTYYFGLFLIKSDPKFQYSLIRKLQEFECPYISLKCLQERLLYKVVLRKAYWDQSIDDEVSVDPVGFKLLSLQAELDIQAGWTNCSAETKAHLKSLKAKGSKSEFLQLCRSLSNYGCVQFNPCSTNFPQQESISVIIAGDYQLKLLSESDELQKMEQIFLVTRMKCWKLASQCNQSQSKNLVFADHPLLELSFEYLFENGSLKWISIISDQAIMMSMCIKSMVDELMRKQRGDKIKKPADHHNIIFRQSYKARDKSTEYLFQNRSGEMDDAATVGAIEKAKFSVKKLTEKLSLVSLLSKSSGSESLSATDSPHSAVHSLPPDISRSTFEGIGDEDL